MDEETGQELIAGTDIPKTGDVYRDRAIGALQMGANYLRTALADAAGCEASTFVLDGIVRAITQAESCRGMLRGPSPDPFAQVTGGLPGGGCAQQFVPAGDLRNR